MVVICFRDKSTFIKCLVFLVSVLIMILVALAIILTNKEKDNHVCKSEHCIKLSAEVILHGDKSVNPCEDFYTYTCANFRKNRQELPPVPPEEELNLLIRQMVQYGDSQPFIMQKKFYLWCANLAAIEMDDSETILDLFYSAGDWPVMRGGKWEGTLFDWTKIAIKNRQLGLKFDWFLDFSIYPDVNGTGLNILKIDIPPLSPLEDSIRDAREDLFTKIAVLLGAPEKIAHYETGTTIDFENKLRTLAEEHRNKQTHWNAISLPKVTIDEVQTLWPNIEWLQLINNITGVSMTGSDYIIFDEVLGYIKDLNKLIYGTPKRIVADYMMWVIVEEYWQYFPEPIREKFEEYYEDQYKLKPETNRQKFCIDESKKQFPLIAESEYIRRHVSQEKKQSVNEMIAIIKEKFMSLIKQATGIQRDVKQKAIRKLQKLKFWVGGPRQVFDEFGFAEDLGLYGFVFRSTNVIDMLRQRELRFYDNYFSAVNRLVTNRTLSFYEKVVNIAEFTVINGNTLVIPAAVLRDAFYNPKLPNYYNYAALGTVLAHKIFEYVFEQGNGTISVDDEDRNYSSRSISDSFESAVKCLIKDSSFFTHNSELKIPKKMRELLADFAAPEVAYQSYKEWSLMHQRQEPKLPALELTPEQLFWFYTSKLSCNKLHSRHNGAFKIIGPLRHSRNFSKDYNCTAYSKMYSTKPCRIL